MSYFIKNKREVLDYLSFILVLAIRHCAIPYPTIALLHTTMMGNTMQYHHKTIQYHAVTRRNYAIRHYVVPYLCNTGQHYAFALRNGTSQYLTFTKQAAPDQTTQSHYYTMLTRLHLAFTSLYCTFTILHYAKPDHHFAILNSTIAWLYETIQY